MIRAAARAAAMRLGVTSFAFIEFDVSTTMTTVVSFWSLGRLACGRATPTSSRLSASSSSAGGTWRRQPGRRGMRFGHRAGLAAARIALAAAARQHDVGDHRERDDDERGEEVGIGERHVVLRSAQDEPAAASRSSAAAPATRNVTSFCCLVALTRVPMWS